MPSGRRITVNVRAPGTRNDQGEFVPGALTALGAWARRRDVSAEKVIETGGIRGERIREWRVRWNGQIARAALTELEVEDETETFRVSSMVEVTEQGRGQPDLRKRWIDLQGIRIP